MRRNVFGILGIALAVLMASVSLAQPVMARGGSASGAQPSQGGGDQGMGAGGSSNDNDSDGRETKVNDCGGEFLGFRPWYDGICAKNAATGEVTIEQPAKGDDDALTMFVWRIVLNVLFDLTLAIGYIALIMIIYGGYLYIMSQGDPVRMAKGKKALTSAVIGTVIAVGASVIVNTIIAVLDINRGGGWQQGELTADRLDNVFNWAYSMAGLVAVIFIIKGGVEYMVSAGDMAKVQRAKFSIIFAAVGLVIVIFAAVITNLIMSTAGGAI